jgi:hypothetical protein
MRCRGIEDIGQIEATFRNLQANYLTLQKRGETRMSTGELFRNQNILAFMQTKITPDDSSPWLFVHIPQSVSYAVRCQIADVLQPEAAIAADDEDGGQTYDTRMSLALERFAKSKEFRERRFVSGHFKVFQIDKIGELANAHAMTIMRDPVDRLLSDFAAQQEGKRVRVTAEAFLKFAKSPANRNILLQFLCPQGMWKPQECIEFIQNRFDFIGIAEDLPMTIKMFHAIHGVRFSAAVASPPLRSGGTLGRSDLSDEMIKTVTLLNALDYEIFRWFHDRFVALKGEFFKLSDRGELFKALSYREAHRQKLVQAV